VRWCALLRFTFGTTPKSIVIQTLIWMVTGLDFIPPSIRVDDPAPADRLRGFLVFTR
jgi:hypothetical protein